MTRTASYGTLLRSVTERMLLEFFCGDCVHLADNAFEPAASARVTCLLAFRCRLIAGRQSALGTRRAVNSRGRCRKTSPRRTARQPSCARCRAFRTSALRLLTGRRLVGPSLAPQAAARM